METRHIACKMQEIAGHSREMYHKCYTGTRRVTFTREKAYHYKSHEAAARACERLGEGWYTRIILVPAGL